jgi:hypothetical protein
VEAAATNAPEAEGPAPELVASQVEDIAVEPDAAEAEGPTPEFVASQVEDIGVVAVEPDAVEVGIPIDEERLRKLALC